MYMYSLWVSIADGWPDSATKTGNFDKSVRKLKRRQEIKSPPLIRGNVEFEKNGRWEAWCRSPCWRTFRFRRRE
jgi:hypothetical protein